MGGSQSLVSLRVQRLQDALSRSGPRYPRFRAIQRHGRPASATFERAPTPASRSRRADRAHGRRGSAGWSTCFSRGGRASWCWGLPMPGAYRRSISETARALDYRRSFAASLSARGAAYVDLSRAPWVDDALFADALHLNARGAAHLSRSLGDALPRPPMEDSLRRLECRGGGDDPLAADHGANQRITDAPQVLAIHEVRLLILAQRDGERGRRRARYVDDDRRGSAEIHVRPVQIVPVGGRVVVSRLVLGASDGGSLKTASPSSQMRVLRYFRSRRKATAIGQIPPGAHTPPPDRASRPGGDPVGSSVEMPTTQPWYTPQSPRSRRTGCRAFRPPGPARHAVSEYRVKRDRFKRAVASTSTGQPARVAPVSASSANTMCLFAHRRRIMPTRAST